MTFYFETAHLRVRKFQADDAQHLFENHLEKEMLQWIPNESYVDMAEAENAIGYYIKCVEQKHLPFVLAIERKDTGELIGDTGVNEVVGNPQEVEIGFSICKQHSGKGYATEIVKAMTAFAVETFEIKALYGRVLHGNDASVKVLEKSGYQFLREEFNAKDDPYGNGMLVYKMVR